MAQSMAEKNVELNDRRRSSTAFTKLDNDGDVERNSRSWFDEGIRHARGRRCEMSVFIGGQFSGGSVSSRPAVSL